MRGHRILCQHLCTGEKLGLIRSASWQGFLFTGQVPKNIKTNNPASIRLQLLSENLMVLHILNTSATISKVPVCLAMTAIFSIRDVLPHASNQLPHGTCGTSHSIRTNEHHSANKGRGLSDCRASASNNGVELYHWKTLDAVINKRRQPAKARICCCFILHLQGAR